MRLNATALTSVLLITALPTQALAQACADPTPAPCIQAKQQSPTQAYQISVYAPGDCDDEIRSAAGTWTAAGSRFSLEDFSYDDSNYVTAGAKTGIQIVFNTRAEMGIYGADNGVTFYPSSSVGSWRRPDGVYVPVVNDADIVINRDKWAAGTIECSSTVYAASAQKYDLTRTMAHELGHAVGLNHNQMTACATYRQGQYTPFSSLCNEEEQAAITMYGAL